MCIRDSASPVVNTPGADHPGLPVPPGGSASGWHLIPRSEFAGSPSEPPRIHGQRPAQRALSVPRDGYRGVMSHASAPWSRPSPPVQDPPRTRSLFYHRLAHADPRHRWWMPLVEGLILLAVLLLLTIGFFLIMVFAAPGRIEGDILAMDLSLIHI